MSAVDTNELFNNSIKDGKLVCSKNELDEFLMYGFLIETTSGKYVTRENKQVDVETIDTKLKEFNINLQPLIENALELAKQNNINKVYVMTQRCYNNYKEQGLIYEHNGIGYFRMFEKEKWLVQIMN